MKLQVLVDNNTLIDCYYQGEPAVCFYIEDGDQRLLFDVGYSDIFIKNARALGIDLQQIDTIILSHGHNDHSRGLTYLVDYIDMQQVKIVAHPDALQRKIFDHQSIGAPFNATELKTMATLQLTKKPIKISQHLTFLSEIPALHHFEPRQQLGDMIDEKLISKPDYVMDDSALVYHGKDGLFIITGCSHSGICNIVEYAKQVCDEPRVVGIIGGFHLLDVSPQLQHTIGYLVNNGIKQLYPCHCVLFNVKAELHKVIPISEVGVSLTLDID